MRIFFPIAICSIAILVGAGGVVIGLWQVFRSVQSAHWPVADGTILSAQMTSYQAKSRRVYSPDISYRYQVAGQNYVGKQFAFGKASGSSDYIQLILDRYSIGKMVFVHYSPGNPQLAVLETGIYGGTWTNLIVGTLFVIIGSVLLQPAMKGKFKIRGSPLRS